MRYLCLLLFIVCLPNQLAAQDTLRRSVYAGLDVLKSVWPLVGVYPGIRSAYTVEPSVIVPLYNQRQYLHITPGFTSFKAKDGVDIKSGKGYYLKVGLEQRKRNFGVGLAGLATVWQDEGTYRFNGAYFGDYIGLIPRRNRVAVGGEFFLNFYIPTTSRLVIRLQPRVTVVAPFTGYSERADPPYLPGVGLMEGSRWRASNGISLQLLYRTSPN